VNDRQFTFVIGKSEIGFPWKFGWQHMIVKHVPDSLLPAVMSVVSGVGYEPLLVIPEHRARAGEARFYSDSVIRRTNIRERYAGQDRYHRARRHRRSIDGYFEDS
jgi:hypothetical protein